tara:strand:+ start:2949 stop:3410 length:462 start_codon:yes stop_codon:yes gene_type:complete
MRNGEDVIADLYEVTTKEEPEKAIAFQFVHPYNISVIEPSHVMYGDDIQKMSNPELNFQPWAPLAKDRKIMIKMEEVVSAYETFDEVIQKYNQLVEAVKGGTRGNSTSATGGTSGTNGGSNDPTTNKSNPVETKEGIPVGEGDGAGRGAKSVN